MENLVRVGLVVVLMAQAVNAQQPDAVNTAPRAHDTYSMVLAHYGRFQASDPEFESFYGNGSVYGGEVRIPGPRIADRRLQFWAEGSHRQRKGRLSFTGEPTKVTVRAAEAGLLYQLTRGNASPYVGGGIGYYTFSETSEPLGKAKQSKPGYCVLAGVSMAVSGRVVLDVRVKYSASRMQPADFPIKVGGATFGGGIGVRF